MIQDKNNTIHWTADEGKTFVHKIDGTEMGTDIWLGVGDSIDNYEETDTHSA